MTVEVLILSLMVVFVFGWNNGAVAVGALTGPRLLTRGRAAILVALGLLSGVLAEGWKMNSTTLGTAGEEGNAAALATLLTTLILLTSSNLTLIPVSLSNITVGAYVGALINRGGSVNTHHLALTIAAWVVGPLLTFCLALLIYRIVRSYVARLNLASLDLFNRLAVYCIVFAVTYSLAANNIGFILSFTNQVTYTPPPFVVGAASSAVAGVLMMWRGMEASMAEKLVVLSPPKTLTGLFSASLVVWLLTQFSIPSSLTQNMLGGVVGAATTTRVRMINLRNAGRIVALWSLTSLVSVAVGFTTASLI